MEYVYLIILLALIEYVVFGALVGAARGKHNIRAPAVTGHEDFERKFRVQQNTLEGLVIFIPGIWLFGMYLSAIVAAVIGAVMIVGRAIYARSYIAAPETRGTGAMICGLGNMVLLLGGLIGVIRALF